MEDERKREKQTYRSLLHAMQSGVLISAQLDGYVDSNYPRNDLSPKHLRVGIDSALVSLDALVSLLVDSGTFTQDEWNRALNKAMKKEVETYEQKLTERIGTKVVLK